MDRTSSARVSSLSNLTLSMESQNLEQIRALHTAHSTRPSNHSSSSKIRLCDLFVAIFFFVDIVMSSFFVTVWILFDKSLYNNVSTGSIFFSALIFVELVTLNFQISKEYRQSIIKLSFNQLLAAFSLVKCAQECVLVAEFNSRSYCQFVKPFLTSSLVQSRNWFSFLSLLLLTVKWIHSIKETSKSTALGEMKTLCILAALFSASFAVCFGSKIWYFHLTYRMDVHCYNHDKMLKLFPEHEEQLSFLKNISTDESAQKILFWTHPVKIGTPVIVQISEKSFKSWEAKFRLIKLRWILLHGDVQQLIDEEHKNVENRKIFKEGYRSSDYQFDQYHNLEEIMSFLDTISQEYPEIVDLIEIGRSFEGRPLTVVKISTCKNASSCSKNKPKFWMDFGIHPREWITQATAVFTVFELVMAFLKKDDSHLKDLEWYLLPVANPDGYLYTWTADRLWRKSRQTTDNPDCIGTDLNRNFPFKWGEGPGYTDPCSWMYAGERAFSAPETAAIGKFLLGEGRSFQGNLNVHAFSQFWMYPYSYAKGVYPDDRHDLDRWARDAVSALKSVNGTEYKVGSAAELLYECYGVAHDWAKHDAKIKYSYAVELRPGPDNEIHFKLPPEDIIPTAKEIFEAISVIAHGVIEAKKQEF